MHITVDIDRKALDRRLTAIEERQIPFALSKTLNKTAIQIQEGIRKGMEERFTLRRKTFVLRGIKIERQAFATKKRLQAVRIHVDETRTDFLNKFEEGEEKRAHTGRRFVAPSSEVFRLKSGIIPRSQRPASFKFDTAGRGSRGTFVVQGRDGRRFIFQRARGSKRQLGPFAPGERDPNTKLLYTVLTRAETPRSLRFVETATRIYQASFQANFDHYFAEAMRTAR